MAAKGKKRGAGGAGGRQFIARVMSQLPGLPEPRIMVRLMAGTQSTEGEAQSAADYYQEPVAMVSMDGRLLAYRIPSGSRQRK